MTWRVALVAAATVGCDAGPPPTVYERPPYETTRVPLPHCTTELPPVRDRDGNAAINVAEYVEAKDLCDAVTALKEWIDSAPLA